MSLEEAPEEKSEAVTQQPEIKIIRETRFVAQPMTPEEAVMQMNLRSNDFLVFSNAATHDVNVVYRRADGTYGLIETGNVAHA